MTEVQFYDLLDQYLTGTLAPEGKRQLATALEDPKFRGLLEAHLEGSFQGNLYLGEEDAAIKASIQQYLQAQMGEQRPAKVFTLRRWVAAASIILVLGLSTWFFFLKGDPKAGNEVATTTPATIDIPPGKVGAILTLADGRQVSLDSVQGSLAEQGGAVAVNKDGQLVYEMKGGAAAPVYNTVTTPNGRQYHLTLADGSKVWLNSGSSISFPTAFSGTNRKVQVTGEAYFEVAKDAQKPFIVSTNGQEITVLGTQFNVNSYENEGGIRTTLLEGSIRLTSGGQTKLLQPGQQTVVQSAGAIQLVDNVDVASVMAWKNGLFSFQNADLKTILRQAARWYDIEVQYQAEPKVSYSGKIGRSLTLKEFLSILEETRIHYQLEGRKLTITP